MGRRNNEDSDSDSESETDTVQSFETTIDDSIQLPLARLEVKKEIALALINSQRDIIVEMIKKVPISVVVEFINGMNTSKGMNPLEQMKDLYLD